MDVVWKGKPVKHATGLFLRFIMHECSDKYDLQIVRDIVPAMRSESKIVVMDGHTWMEGGWVKPMLEATVSR